MASRILQMSLAVNGMLAVLVVAGDGSEVGGSSWEAGGGLLLFLCRSWSAQERSDFQVGGSGGETGSLNSRPNGFSFTSACSPGMRSQYASGTGGMERYDMRNYGARGQLTWPHPGQDGPGMDTGRARAPLAPSCHQPSSHQSSTAQPLRVCAVHAVPETACLAQIPFVQATGKHPGCSASQPNNDGMVAKTFPAGLRHRPAAAYPGPWFPVSCLSQFGKGRDVP